MNAVQICNFINQLILSLSSWLWPIVVLITVSMFKTEISNVIRNRILKAEILGQKFELAQEIDEFQKVTQQATEIIEAQTDDLGYIKDSENLKKTEEIIKAASINPQLGIIALSPLIENELRTLATSLGVIKYEPLRKLSFINLIRLLVDKKFLPEQIQHSASLFWELRNKIIHGYTLINKKDVIRVLDIGLELLKTIQEIPHDSSAI